MEQVLNIEWQDPFNFNLSFNFLELLTHPWMQDSQVSRRPNALMANLLGARRGLWRRLMWTPEQVKKMWFLLLQVNEKALQQ